MQKGGVMDVEGKWKQQHETVAGSSERAHNNREGVG